MKGIIIQSFLFGSNHPVRTNYNRAIRQLGRYARQEPLYLDGACRKLSARQISAATSVLAEQGMNIDAIKRLTGRIPLDECDTDARTRACIEFSVRGTPKDRIAMQESLMKLASELEMDFSFQLDNMYRRMRRLICFDMDSTLIETEVIDELAIRRRRRR